jgi:hypothetical protein
MLEIVGIIALARWMGSTLESKGHSKWLGAAGPIGWVMAEICGFIIGEMLGLELGGYVLAIGLALCWAATCAIVVMALPAGEGAPPTLADPSVVQGNPWA